MQRRRSDLTARWLRRVLDDAPGPDSGAGPALMEHLPGLVERIVAALEDRAPQSRSGRAWVAGAPAGLRCPLPQAVRELFHFRAALLALCADAGVILDAEEELRIHAAIDESMGALAVGAEHAARDALEETETRLRLATQAGRVGSWAYEPATSALSWDARCKELFGLPAAPATGTPAMEEGDYDTLLSGLHVEDRAHTHLAIQRALDPGSGGESRFRCRTVGLGDQIERRLEGRARAVLDERGRVVRLIGTFVEASDRTGVVADEMRGSITRMMSAATALLEDEKVPDTQALALRRVNASAERLARTLELLESSRRRSRSRVLRPGDRSPLPSFTPAPARRKPSRAPG